MKIEMDCPVCGEHIIVDNVEDPELYEDGVNTVEFRCPNCDKQYRISG